MGIEEVKKKFTDEDILAIGGVIEKQNRLIAVVELNNRSPHYIPTKIATKMVDAIAEYLGLQ